MNGTGDQGPRKLNSTDQQDYKEIGNTQASSMKEKVQAVNAKEHNKSQFKKTAQVSNVESSTSSNASKGNWRLGNFEESPLLAPGKQGI